MILKQKKDYENMSAKELLYIIQRLAYDLNRLKYAAIKEAKKSIDRKRIGYKMKKIENLRNYLIDLWNTKKHKEDAK